jgi:hypothetical protein
LESHAFGLVTADENNFSPVTPVTFKNRFDGTIFDCSGNRLADAYFISEPSYIYPGVTQHIIALTDTPLQARPNCKGVLSIPDAYSAVGGVSGDTWEEVAAKLPPLPSMGGKYTNCSSDLIEAEH